MSKYRVSLVNWVAYSAHLSIEGCSQEDATQRALDFVNDPDNRKNLKKMRRVWGTGWYFDDEDPDGGGPPEKVMLRDEVWHKIDNTGPLCLWHLKEQLGRLLPGTIWCGPRTTKRSRSAASEVILALWWWPLRNSHLASMDQAAAAA
jgi:hypothetical protein